MLIDALIKIFDRDLNKLKIEVTSYRSENNLWLVEKEINNCAGNVVLHLVGNLNHFIGAILGDTGYVRERDNEFSLKNVSKAQLLKQIDDTLLVVKKTLNSMTDKDLNREYPLVVFKEKMTTTYFLVHLTTHLAYHLGQINYHRRLLD